MVDSYTPQPLSERKSQHLTFMQYIWDSFLPKWGMTIGGLVGGWFVGGMIGGATGASHGRAIGNNVGSLLGGFVLGFMHWRKDAANQMDTAELADKLKNVVPMAMTPDQVKQEIHHTKDMLAYEQRQNAKLKAMAQSGPKTALDHAATSDAALAEPQR